MQKIQEYTYEGKGLTRVFENEKWMVGIKNWKPENDITGLTCLERHNITDELFILLAGRCTLLYANETENGLVIDKVEMEPSPPACGTTPSPSRASSSSSWRTAPAPAKTPTCLISPRRSWTPSASSSAETLSVTSGDSPPVRRAGP